MSADTYDCKQCGALVIVTHRAHHEANACAQLAKLRRKRAYNMERMRKKRRGLPTRKGKPAKCALEGCGAEFVSQGVTHRYCCPRHADVARQGDPDEADAARLALEMEPIRREEELYRRAAEAVPMLTGERSFRLWLVCLGVAA